MRRPLLLTLALTGAAALAAAPAAGAPQRKRVGVGDFFFAPTKLTVNRGSVVVFRWLPENVDLHDVTLVKGPPGVRKWQSATAATDYSYRRRLRKPGRYTVVCTLHPDTMEMTIRVRR